MNRMEILVFGLNHQTAPVELREKFSIHAARIPGLIQALKARAGLREAAVLSTCNRFEIYGIAEPGSVSLDEVFQTVTRFSGSEVQSDRWPIRECAYEYRDGECIRHLFRVASSLDSLVVGETEIVGQVKTAYQAAHSCGGTGKWLNRLFQKALSVSKEVRSRSGIGRCSTSVGSVSVDLAARIFGEELKDRTILIIGAGKMSEATLRHLAKHGAKSILVSNRSFERAQELARTYSGRAFRLSELPRLLVEADIVISSTSAPVCILHRKDFEHLPRARGGRPLLLIDLAVPRDIDPAVQDFEGIYLYNVDQLSQAARHNMSLRQAEAAECERWIVSHAETAARRLLGVPSPEPAVDSFPGAWSELPAAASQAAS
jgi:glutamyl-tRNA reductase